ncbi:MAG: hypothetical protein L6R39_000884 [Caloplaca ligustica]|nr:MAG: hypothetical protein L6R39_000884 [Caloplaca ligustica]
MLVRSLFLPRLAPLLLLAADCFLLISPAHAKQVTYRQPLSTDGGEDGSRIWAEGGQEGVEASQRAIAVHKMMDNEADMFFPQYWRFDDGDDDWDTLRSNPDDTELHAHNRHGGLGEAGLRTNLSLVLPFDAPFALHRDTDNLPSYAHLARGLLLQGRAFHCPNGTDASASLSPIPETATSPAAEAAKHARGMSKTAPKDTRIALEQQVEVAVSLVMLVWGL